MDKEKDQIEEIEGQSADINTQKLQMGKLGKIAGEDQELPEPEDDEDSDIPQEENEGFDPSFKDVARRVTVSKKQVHHESEEKKEEPEDIERTNSKQQIEDRFEIVDSDAHEESKNEKKLPLKRQTTLLERDENGEKILIIEEGLSLIFPHGNKAILVRMKISSFHFSLTHISS